MSKTVAGDRALEELRSLALTLERTEGAIAAKVAQARRAGRSWQEIADSLGMSSRQHAWKKYHEASGE